MKVHADFLDMHVDKDFLREYYLTLDEYLMKMDSNGKYDVSILDRFYRSVSKQHLSSPFYQGVCTIAVVNPILAIAMVGMMYNLMEEDTEPWEWE